MKAQELRGHWDQIRGKVKEKWGELTDDDLKIIGGNVDQLIGKIEQRTGETRRSIEHFLDELMAEGESMLSRAKEAASDYSQAAYESARSSAEHVVEHARDGYERVHEVVRQRPFESMAVVFGLGFVTGLALGMLMASDS